MSATFAPQERQYYDQLFAVIDKHDAGVLPGQDALPFFMSSNLPQQTLGEIWALSDPENNGFLTKEQWYTAARIIGWMQKGGQTQVDESLGTKPGPYPTFSGQAPPPPQVPLSAQNTGVGRISAQNTGAGGLPPLTPADRTKFTRIFVGQGPQNGLISGDKARDVFVKSQLSYDKLGQIWNLSDTQQRGSLDLTDFIIGMYLIQSVMANPSLILPSTLPPGTYELASGGRPAPPLPSASPIQHQHTGPGSPVKPQYTGPSSVLQPQRTGQSAIGTPPRHPPVKQFSGSPAVGIGASAFGGPNRQMSGLAPQWDVTAEAKANSDRFFQQLDTQNRGVIEGDVAVPFMLQSQLDEGTLASIWDLADIRREGKLTRDEFAVAMHLINTKLEGKELPATLPTSLVPPSLRGQQFDAGQQEVLSSSGPTSATKDLFDLFSDEPAPVSAQPATFAAPSPPSAAQPPAPAQSFQASAFLPQPPSRRGTAQPTSQQLSPFPTGSHLPPPPAPGGFGAAPFPPQSRSMPSNDLLGDDAAGEAAPAVPDNSAEIGNKQNQLDNTSRHLDEVSKTRAELEKTAASSAKTLEELEAKLSEARTKHETETKAVEVLRSRVSEQAEKVKQLEKEVIAAESDLSAMKSEKDELGQALLRDKEEVRGYQKMMKEIEEEKKGLVLLLEKVKKEARQQKGMVTIAKKQLSTAEGSRDSLRKDIDDAQNPVEEEPEPVATSSGAIAHTPTPPGMAAGVPLPASPSPLSPAPTGTSQRSNNPFDRLRNSQPQPQARSAPAPPSGSSTPTAAEPQSSPAIGTAALAGVGAAVGAVAGVAVAGAETLYDAAKGAIVGEDPSPSQTQATSKEVQEEAPSADPFGAPTVTQKSPSAPAAPIEHDTDPFGLPATSPPAASTFDDFDSGFGDSFDTSKLAQGGSASTHEPAPATDFDSAFAEFDKEPVAEGSSEPPAEVIEEAHQQMPEGIPSGIPKSAIPADLRPAAERTFSTQASAPSTAPDTPVVEVPPVHEDERDIAPDVPSSEVAPAHAVEPEQVEELASSDEEDEGPEDLEGPKKGYATQAKDFSDDELPVIPKAQVTPPTASSALPSIGIAPALPVLSPPVASTPGSSDEPQAKVRRSAPPPPASKSVPAPAVAPANAVTAGDDFDPFGSSFGPSTSTQQPQQVLSLPPGAAPAEIPVQTTGPKMSKFDDDDDFDFSDLAPAQVSQETTEKSQPQNSAFDDEFANFDDEFDKPSSKDGSDGSNGLAKSYEMVSPHQESAPQGQPQGRAYDEWGFGPSSSGDLAKGQATRPGQVPPPNDPNTAASAFSFDDAFGGDFEPAPFTQQPSAPTQESYAPPPGPPPSSHNAPLNPPSLPQRKESTGAQADDLEDVKKLCAMGFPRELVIGALDANGYDFQKALNVLLQ